MSGEREPVLGLWGIWESREEGRVVEGRLGREVAHGWIAN
jgi:hypothetical protein